jgi:CheY-like chemotaxis protein
MLSESGYATIQAETLKQALLTLNVNWEQFRLVIVDMHFTDQSEEQAIQTILNDFGGRLPLIFLSTKFGDAHQPVLPPSVTCITKPYHPDDIFSALAKEFHPSSSQHS